MASSISMQTQMTEPQQIDSQKNGKTELVQRAEKDTAQTQASSTVQEDVVEISESGKKMADHESKTVQLVDGQYSTVPDLPEDNQTTTVASTSMASGRSVVINKVWQEGQTGYDSKETFKGYQANVFSSDGKLESSFVLRQDTIINEKEDGTLNVSAYTKGDETDGDDVIIGMENKDLSGGTGDDTIVDLSGEYNAEAESAEDSSTEKEKKESSKGSVIDSGDGDDRVIIADGRHTSVKTIKTGSGDDSIETDWVENSVINTGSGNDSITTGIVLSSSVNTGTGNDSLRVKDKIANRTANEVLVHGITSSSVDMGDGDNSLESVSLYRSSLDTGEGGVASKIKHIAESTINSKGKTNLETEYISRSDIDVSDSTELKSGTISESNITKTDDRNTGSVSVSAGWVGSSKINTGNGHDSIRIKDSFLSEIDTGAGDDSVKVSASFLASRLSTGAGDDNFNAWEIDESLVDTGAGNDTISSKRGLSDSIASLGEGDDILNCYIGESLVDLGKGNDVINAYAITNGIITGMGLGNKTINLVKGFNEEIGSVNGYFGKDAPAKDDFDNPWLNEILLKYEKWKETGEFELSY